MMNKLEYLRIIEEQKTKIEKYEKKLKDVIQAYKSLLSEKNALEQSLKALSTDDDSPNHEETIAKENSFDSSADCSSTKQQQTPGSCVAVLNVDSPDNSEAKVSVDDRESVASSEDTEDSTLKIPSDRSPAADRAKIATLKRALATISAEKSRQEVAFTEDRKRLLNEQDSLKNELEGQKEEWQKSKSHFEQQINELRANIRQLHCERECEQSDHGAMLKELQQKLSKERIQNEHLLKQVSSLNSDLKTKEHQPFELLERISSLNAEVFQLKEKLTCAENQLKEIPDVLKLQSDLAETKMQSQKLLDSEKNMKELFQQDLIKMQNQNEERVGELETKICELSANIGEYERNRLTEMETSEKLKNRVKFLEKENHNLATSSLRVSENELEDETFHSLTNKCKNLIERMKYVQTDDNAILEAIGFQSGSSKNKDEHQQCRKDFEQIREEFEKYKVRSHVQLKSKNVSKDIQDSEQLATLNQMVVGLQHKLQESTDRQRLVEKEYEKNLDELRQTISTLKESYNRSLSELEQNCQRRIVDIEYEATKQRERTLDVLVEKEKEINTLRAFVRSTSRMANESASTSSTKIRPDSRTSYNSVEGLSLEHERSSSVVNDFDIASSTPADPAPTTLYYSQELARKDAEIKHLKYELRRFDAQLIESKHSLVSKELLHLEITEMLKDEIRKQEAKLARCADNSNLEYLKNVFVQFAMSTDNLNKQHMLKAIAVSLKLSSKEIDTIMKQYFKNSWFAKS